MRNKKVIVVILGLLCSFNPHVSIAQMQYFAPDAKSTEQSAEDPPRKKSFVVTPVAECFSLLPLQEALEIRRDFENPWQECRRRVSERGLDKKADAQETKEKEDDSSKQTEDKETKHNPKTPFPVVPEAKPEQGSKETQQGEEKK